MKERLLEEIQKGSKGAVMKKHIITYLREFGIRYSL